MTFWEAAEKVLADHGNKPLHYREITERAMQTGYLETKGATPEATMVAVISETNRRREARGEDPLFEALGKASLVATPLFASGDYTGYLKAFAVLKAPVDAFFDSVMVNAEDPAVRRNRLALLADLRREMNRVADLSKLAA